LQSSNRGFPRVVLRKLYLLPIYTYLYSIQCRNAEAEACPGSVPQATFGAGSPPFALHYARSRPDSREARERFEESPGSTGQSAR